MGVNPNCMKCRPRAYKVEECECKKPCNINETHAKQENGKWVPDRQNGIFTHNPQVDECNDIIVA